jgi:hypothetical protein
VPDAVPDAVPDVVDDAVRDMLYTPLFDQAEAVRWRMSDLPWRDLDRSKVTPELCALVREIAFAEQTTFGATRRFLTDLADDVDLTQWIAVWFYEETKHPDVLLRWLRQLDVTVDAGFVQRGRATAPFMRSRMGTFVTNIISEMVASAGYVVMRDTSPEPVLARIAACLAADEARHCASFYAYAHRHLARARDPDRERRDALKVLFMWFQNNELVGHPVSELFQRYRVPFDITTVRDRVSRLIGLLVGVELTGSTDLGAALRRLGGNHATT